MNIQAEKLEIMKMILNTENPSILKRIKNIFTKEKDFWNTLSDLEKEDIMKGIEELDNGDKYSYEEVMKKHR
jgi:hypothetical protein